MKYDTDQQFDIDSDGDSSNGEEELSMLVDTVIASQSKNLKRKLYRKLIKKINSIGGIRKFFQGFLKERRASLMVKKNVEEVIDEYFECCKKNILDLESKRIVNFQSIKSDLIKR